jgi:diguanylate cyclase (GGDEF)-like protein
MIRRLMTPTVQISMGLLTLTLSLILVAYSVGLLPNEEKAALETRARISEGLAIQLASLASRNDEAAIKDTIAFVLSRNGDVLSIAVRGVDGKVLVGSDNHDTFWLEPPDGKSTPTHMQVPLLNVDVPEGKIELVFRPIAKVGSFLGLPRTLLGFLGFIGGAGFGGYYLFLRRALRELDPGRAIPERVKAAFDTLAEGVLIMDERGYVLLANDAFVKNIYPHSEPLHGIRVSKLPWAQLGTGAGAPELPWQTALRNEAPVLGVPMSILGGSGNVHRLMVNATPIVDGKSVVRGVIATFDDVTALHQMNEKLSTTIDELQRSQAVISEKNQELHILASRDALTGCLNRRTFFAEAESALKTARSQQQSMSFLMLDIDHFKSVNDRYGHVVGDEVLVGLVDLLMRICRARDLVGRYGGEEFCIAIMGLGADDVEKLAERVRQAVAKVTAWLPGGAHVTISIGIASLTGAAREIADLVKQADEALYAAKTLGRNRFVNWNKMPGRTGRVGRP